MSRQVARFVAPMKNVEWVEVLPFHQMGAFKWKIARPRLSARRHADRRPTQQVQAALDIFRRRRLPRALTTGGTVMLRHQRPDRLAADPRAVPRRSALGYAVGQINILGFSLGIGAVLFVGLAIGAIAPKAQIAGPIGLIGLIMFLYGIGILYGRQFFEGLSGPGRIYNLLAFVAVDRRPAGRARRWAGCSACSIGQTLGIFAGSMTSTADAAGGARR